MDIMIHYQVSHATPAPLQCFQVFLEVSLQNTCATLTGTHFHPSNTEQTSFCGDIQISEIWNPHESFD